MADNFCRSVSFRNESDNLIHMVISGLGGDLVKVDIIGVNTETRVLLTVRECLELRDLITDALGECGEGG